MNRFPLAAPLAFLRPFLFCSGCFVAIGSLSITDDANAGQRRVQPSVSLPKLNATKAFSNTSILIATLKNASLAVVQAHFLATDVDVDFSSLASEQDFLSELSQHLEAKMSSANKRTQRCKVSLERDAQLRLVVVVSVVAAPEQLFSASRTLARFFARSPRSKSYGGWDKLRRRAPISLVAVSPLSFARSRRMLLRTFAPIFKKNKSRASSSSVGASTSTSNMAASNLPHASSLRLRDMLHPVGFATAFGLSHEAHASLKEFKILLRLNAVAFSQKNAEKVPPVTTLVSIP